MASAITAPPITPPAAKVHAVRNACSLEVKIVVHTAGRPMATAKNGVKNAIKNGRDSLPDIP